MEEEFNADELEEEEEDSGDPRQIKKDLKWAKAKKKHEDLDFSDVLKTNAGRMVMWRVLTQCGVYSACATDKPMEMARSEGKRDIGLWLLEEISYIPGDLYPIMVKEATEREARYRPKRGGK